MNIILGPVDLVVGKSSKDREKIPPSITCLRAEKAIQTSLHEEGSKNSFKPIKIQLMDTKIWILAIFKFPQ